MIVHQRTAILERLTELLQFADICDRRIFNSRTMPIQIKELPAVFIYGLNETSDVDYLRSTNYAEYKKNLEIIIDIKSYLYNYLDLKPLNFYLSGACQKIEILINKHRNVENFWSELTLRSTRLATDESSEKIVGSCELTCDCVYYMDASEFENNDLSDYLTTLLDITDKDGAKESQLIHMRN